TLVGKESITFFSHDDFQHKKRIFYTEKKCIYQSSSEYTPVTSLDLDFEFLLEDGIPPSYSSSLGNVTSLSQDAIMYEIKITIFRKGNFVKLQGTKKIVSMICKIDRYSLPSRLKLRDASISMKLKRNSNPELDSIQIVALLPSEYIDMNSIMVIPITLIIPDSNMKIEKIDALFKE